MDRRSFCRALVTAAGALVLPYEPRRIYSFGSDVEVFRRKRTRHLQRFLDDLRPVEPHTIWLHPSDYDELVAELAEEFQPWHAKLELNPYVPKGNAYAPLPDFPVLEPE